jgi:hypothetical protein
LRLDPTLAARGAPNRVNNSAPAPGSESR